MTLGIPYVHSTAQSHAIIDYGRVKENPSFIAVSFIELGERLNYVHNRKAVLLQNTISVSS